MRLYRYGHSVTGVCAGWDESEVEVKKMQTRFHEFEGPRHLWAERHPCIQTYLPGDELQLGQVRGTCTQGLSSTLKECSKKRPEAPIIPERIVGPMGAVGVLVALELSQRWRYQDSSKITRLLSGHCTILLSVHSH